MIPFSFMNLCFLLAGLLAISGGVYYMFFRKPAECDQCPRLRPNPQQVSDPGSLSM